MLTVLINLLTGFWGLAGDKHNNVSLLCAFSVQLSLRVWLTVTQTVLELYVVKNKLLVGFCQPMSP